jgi:hypothetical protein
LDEETEGRLGYQVLQDAGVVPLEKRSTAQHVAEAEAGQDGDRQQRVEKCAQRLAEIAIERAKAFGQPLFKPDGLPELEEIFAITKGKMDLP